LNAYKGRRRKNRNYLEGTICNFNHRRIEVLNVHSCRNEDENEEDEEDEEDEDDQEEEEEGKNLKKKTKQATTIKPKTTPTTNRAKTKR